MITITSSAGEVTLSDEQLAAIAPLLGYQEIKKVQKEVTFQRKPDVPMETKKIIGHERNAQTHEEYVAEYLMRSTLGILADQELKVEHEIAEANKQEQMKQAMERILEREEFAALRPKVADGKR